MTEPSTLTPQLAQEFAEARQVTDKLFTHLDPAALYDRPIAERHRMIFYLGHLEAFDWNQMKQSGMTASSPKAEFDHLFAFGIDPEPGKLPSDQPADWPRLAEVQQYNSAARELIDGFLIEAPVDQIHMMIEHRHMHAETFAYILHNLSAEKKIGPAEHSPLAPAIVREMIEIPAGVATLGRRVDSGFGWDNEFEEQQQQVPPFAITKFKVTNGEFLDFMKLTGAVAPHYWFQQGGQWFYRSMFQDLPLPPNWPVYVTWDQATQYARFRGMTLPTEAQFDRAAFGVRAGQQEREFPWGNTLNNHAKHGNFGYAGWNPTPVNASPETESAFGVAQLIGNGWEWTSSVFEPFPGFAPRPTYPGYSANFFDNSHYVMKGASPRTASALVRRSLRNWFRPEYPYMYATFHLVKN